MAMKIVTSRRSRLGIAWILFLLGSSIQSSVRGLRIPIEASIQASIQSSNTKSIQTKLSKPVPDAAPPIPPPKSLSLSPAAQWHAKRRREILVNNRSAIRELESSRSVSFALPLLVASNLALAYLSILSGSIPLWKSFVNALFFGSTLSLWQLQLLHECLHGAMLGRGTKLHKKLRDLVLFWGSFPSGFGYWLYLRHGHLSHHSFVGSRSLDDAFSSPEDHLEDGDVLFVNHRMHMKGPFGPRLSALLGAKPDRDPILSIGRSGFRFWKEGSWARNAALFAFTFWLERILLVANDLFVAVRGQNRFFPAKSPRFHRRCARHARVSLLFKLLLARLANSAWRPLAFLLLSETLWSLPPHPACAMFVTNHGSEMKDGRCVPTSSTYAGKWYAVLTLGTNFHREHHDFPTVPLHKLGKLRDIAGGDWYERESPRGLGEVVKTAFGSPDFYACMDVGAGAIGL